jgi:hypothetical protein
MSLLKEKYVIIDKAGDMHVGRLSKASQDVIKDKLIALIDDCRLISRTDMELFEHQSGGEELPVITRPVIKQKVREL